MRSDADLIKNRLDALPMCFDSLKEMVYGEIPDGCLYHENSIRAGRFRKYEHEHYRITMYAPADPNWLVERRSFEVPLDYLKFLSYMNGLELSEIALWFYA